MSGIAMIVLAVLAAYVAVGLATAVAFIAGGASRILAEPAPVTIGARILMLPAAIALWPVILKRLIRSGSRPGSRP